MIHCVLCLELFQPADFGRACPLAAKVQHSVESSSGDRRDRRLKAHECLYV